LNKRKENGNYFISLTWFKEDPIKRTEGASIGIDTGYRKLIVTSENQRLGCDEMLKIYNSIVNKKRNSKNYKKVLAYRDNLVNMYSNMINTEGVKCIIIEDLNKVKYKSKFGNKINDKVSRWVYRKLIDKIKMMCEVKGITLVNVSPAYTSQTCSLCGSVHKDNRHGDLFKCTECGYEIDADYNASINIRNKGAIVPIPDKLHYNSL
jgi:IS605 OrfB family transposase